MAYEQTKEMLTKMRAREAVRFWKSAEYNELEKAYGDYLFVPLDIPIIQANDQQAFLDFFHKNADYTRRVKEEVGGPPTAVTKNYNPTFKTIDSHPTGNSAWLKNYVADLFYNFSEIFEQIYEYYPIDPDTLNFALWSSQLAVHPHRDEISMIDMPINFRLKLFDSNPCETLKLHLSPIEKPMPVAAYIFKMPKDTNSWVWNNLRLKHSSIKMTGYEKILMIFYTNYSLNMNKFVDILDRSISKYKDALIIDTYTTSADYINH